MIYNDSSFGIKYFSNIEQRFTDETNEICGQAHKHIVAMAVSLRSLKKSLLYQCFFSHRWRLLHHNYTICERVLM